MDMVYIMHIPCDAKGLGKLKVFYLFHICNITFMKLQVKLIWIPCTLSNNSIGTLMLCIEAVV